MLHPQQLMNSAKSVEYASELLNQIFINSNLTNLVTSYLMSHLENKNIVRTFSGQYINLGAIAKIYIYPASTYYSSPRLELSMGGDVREYHTDKAIVEKIVMAFGSSDLIEDFNKVFGNDAQK